MRKIRNETVNREHQGSETHNLLLEFLNGVEITLIIEAPPWNIGLALLSDPAFQLCVVLLQAPHPLQVAGQSVIQELHCLLLVAVERPFLTPRTAPHQARTVAATGNVTRCETATGWEVSPAEEARALTSGRSTSAGDAGCVGGTQ